jgi:hypothetical protein
MSTEAGWRADPTGRHELRYWDGTTWTHHVADRGVTGVDADLTPAAPVATPPPPSPTASAPVEFTRGTSVAATGLALLVVGSFAPWAAITTVFGDVSIGGTNGDGVLTLILGGVAAVFTFLVAKRRGAREGFVWVVFAAGALALVVSGYDAINIARVAERESTAFAEASVGWGLIACVIGSVLIVAGSLLRRTELTRQG